MYGSLFATTQSKMRILLSTICCFGCLLAMSQNLEEVRQKFHEAVLDVDETRTFHRFLKEVEAEEPVLKAYKAASEAMLARVVWNPFTKLMQVMKYDDQMKVAIEEDSQNIEIRFLRFAIEYNLPKFLSMSKHLKEDRDVIIEQISSTGQLELDPSFSHYILYFMKDTGLCTSEQISLMEQSLGNE